MKKRVHTSWGSVASQYHGTVGNPDSYQQAVILPNLLRLLEALWKPGQEVNIIDIGCGEGLFARALADLGANVTGADIAPEMIAVAKAKSPKSIHYQIAPSHQLSFAKNAAYDAAIIILAIQNIERFRETFRECARILKPGGTLLFVINHPAFRIPKRTAWDWDKINSVQFRRCDAYLSESREKIDMDPGKTSGKRFTFSFHRPLQSYVQALAENGFVVAELEEWISHKKSQRGPRAKAEDTARREFPMFMMIRACKLD